LNKGLMSPKRELMLGRIRKEVKASIRKNKKIKILLYLGPKRIEKKLKINKSILLLIRSNLLKLMGYVRSGKESTGRKKAKI